MRNALLRAPCFLALALLAAAPLAGCGGGPSTTGEPLTKSGQVSAGGPMAVSSSGIFFFNAPDENGPTALARIPLAGGAPFTLDPNTSATYMALDQDSVFYDATIVASEGTGKTAFAIARVPQAGGVRQTLVSGTGILGGMAVGGGRLAYITQSFDDDPDFGGIVQGTGAIVVQPIEAVGQPPAASIPLVKGLAQPCAIAADEAKVYWLDCSTRELLSLPFSPSDGEKPELLAAGLGFDIGVFAGGPGSVPLAVAAGQLYWLDGGGDVRAMPAAGGTPTTIASQDDWSPAALMADATAVYWTTSWDYSGASGDGPDVNDRDPGLWTAPAGGGSATQVLGLAASPTAAAMDADYVYWISDTDQSVRRLQR